MRPPHLNVEHYRTDASAVEAVNVLVRDKTQFAYCYRDSQHVISYPNPHAVRVPRQKDPK